ncbi:hypothetical protein [Oscillatoria sp. FACHB-1406]|uniref:hypothetical protein n=1 Tax=Oscillatoria sp. FACHB-1406 TaxID=2692846 RepID=UPI001681D87B|nr:hypothetical protein [Oscillatoria sp. FACHB-1406]MBD2580550.1 hypothetical protein [Oscillatoria sp. FACHB-1406]
MTSVTLRQLWSLVENTQAAFLLGQDDASLVTWLLDRLSEQQALESMESEWLGDYIRSKTSLIRDLAEQR